MSTDEAAWLRLGHTDPAAAARARTLRAMVAPFRGLLADLLSYAVRRAEERDPVRTPLPDRVVAVRAGQAARLLVVLYGDAAWLPPRHAAERFLHLHGGLARHTGRSGSAAVAVPTDTLVPAAVRRPLARHELESPTARRRGWVALELVDRADESRVTLLGHRADLALLGLASGWPYPRLVDVGLGL